MNAKISNELDNRKDVEQFLYELSKLSISDLDLTSFLREIHLKISDLMFAKNFYIAIYHEDKDMYRFPYYADEYDKVDPDAFENLEGSLTDHIRKTGKAEIITAEREKEIFKGKFKIVGEYSHVWIGAPILEPQTNKAMGVIALQDYERKDVYDENDVKTLEIIASNIGLFIERINNLSRLKKANKTKDKFFSIIAHDLRNPFQQLLSSSEFLLDELKSGQTDDALELAKLINDSAHNSYMLLQDLLEWSRAQMDAIEFNPVKINIKEILLDVLTLYKKMATRKGIKLTNSIDTDAFVFADKDMVRFILRNLIINAIKFTKRKGSITIDSHLNGKFVVISVSDTGIGIEQDRIDSLFEVEQRKSTPGTQQEKGTGLGLVLCKEFVEKNGGFISVKSEVGSGSKFEFTLPLI